MHSMLNMAGKRQKLSIAISFHKKISYSNASAMSKLMFHRMARNVVNDFNASLAQ